MLWAEFWGKDKWGEIPKCEGIIIVGGGDEVRLQQGEPLQWDWAAGCEAHVPEQEGKVCLY